MKHIKIDVVAETVTWINVEASLKEWYSQIGNGCGMVEIPVRFENEDSLVIDEEGFYNDHPGGFKFTENGNVWWIIGNALIIGGDDEGESVDAKSKIEDIKAAIVFLTPQELAKYVNDGPTTLVFSC